MFPFSLEFNSLDEKHSNVSAKLFISIFKTDKRKTIKFVNKIHFMSLIIS